jgi:superfamily II DNA helicase RecQ
VLVICCRPNIFLHSDSVTEHYEVELGWIMDHLCHCGPHAKQMIVYVSTINMCTRLYVWTMRTLGSAAYKDEHRAVNSRIVDMYHAHIDTDSRDRILSEFQKPQGHLRLLFATVAFGMGIQITDVDAVVHWGLTK